MFQEDFILLLCLLNVRMHNVLECFNTMNVLDFRIAVMFVPSTMCAVNSERVKGMMRIQINSVEALGIAVVPVLQPVWNTLPDFEKIPFLMRAVRRKLPDDETTQVITPV